jgi:hypothetical protein
MAGGTIYFIDSGGTYRSEYISSVNTGGQTLVIGNARTISASTTYVIVYAGFNVANNALVSLQPASSLTAGQTHITQTLTNASSTGGTVNGYNQTLTVNNTASASTTNGFNLTVTDNSAGGLGNTNAGLKVTLNGSNGAQNQLGVDISVNKGIGIRAISSAPSSTGLSSCGPVSDNVSFAVCADSTSTTKGTGIFARSSSSGSAIDSYFGTGAYGRSDTSGAAGLFYTGVKGTSLQTAAAAYTSIGVFGNAKAGTGATTYGGYFTYDSTSSATLGSALYASNSSIAANILQLQDNTTDVLTVADGGLVSLQPAASLTAGQTHISQTLTNASSTGGTVNGYSQTLTVANTTSVSTTNGFNLSVTDNTALANTNTGLKVTLSGSNANQTQVGVDVSVNAGIAIRGSSTGTESAINCGTTSGSIGTCGSATGTGGVGVFGYSSQGNSVIGQALGAGVVGYNSSTPTSGQFSAGVKGIGNSQNNGVAYTSLGVYGEANGGTTAAVYGGYFTLNSINAATSGAALYAATPTYSAAGSGNGINAVNVLQTAGGAGQVASATTGVTAGNGAAISLAAGAGGAATGASGANTAGAGGTVAIQGGNGGAATSGTGGAGSSITLTAGNGGNGSTAGGNGGNITLAAGSAGTGGSSVAGSVIIKNAANSAGAFQIQNASSNSVFGVDTSAGQALFGKANTLAGQLVVYGGTSGSVTISVPTTTTSYSLVLPSAAGNASDCLKNSATPGQLTFGACGGAGGGQTRVVTLIPEYPGAVLSASGSNNTGTMNTTYDSTNRHNYYNWVSSQGALNTYDIFVRTQIPSEYASSFGTFKIWVYGDSNSTTNNDVKITVRDNSGTACATSVSVLPGTAATWTQQTVSLSGCTFAANDLVTVQVNVSSKSSNNVRVGEISYQYSN